MYKLSNVPDLLLSMDAGHMTPNTKNVENVMKKEKMEITEITMYAIQIYMNHGR